APGLIGVIAVPAPIEGLRWVADRLDDENRLECPERPGAAGELDRPDPGVQIDDHVTERLRAVAVERQVRIAARIGRGVHDLRTDGDKLEVRRRNRAEGSRLTGVVRALLLDVEPSGVRRGMLNSVAS